MDGDPADICRVYFIKNFCKNITTGGSLFSMYKVLPV